MKLFQQRTLAQLLVIASLTTAISGCSSSQKNPEPPPPTPAQQAMSQLSTDRDMYVGQTQKRIEALTGFSRDMQAQAATTDKVKAKKLMNAAEDLNLILRDVQNQLRDVQAAAPANWVDEKRDVEKIMSRAETHYSNSVQLMQ